MARRKMTEEEIKQKELEKAKTISECKDIIKKSVDDLDDKTILQLQKVLNDYNGMSAEQSINLLFKKFSKGEFKFKVVTKYE